MEVRWLARAQLFWSHCGPAWRVQDTLLSLPADPGACPGKPMQLYRGKPFLLCKAVTGTLGLDRDPGPDTSGQDPGADRKWKVERVQPQALA